MHRFRLFGKLRLLFSHLNVALRVSVCVCVCACVRAVCVHVCVCACACVCSQLYTGSIYLIQRWPTDYILHLWHPRYCQLEDNSGAHPPNSIISTHPTKNTSMDTNKPHNARTESLLEKHFTPVKAHCVRPRFGSETRETTDEKKSSESSSPSDRLKLTTLPGSDLMHKELKVMGFHLALWTKEVGFEEGGSEESNPNSALLELNTWIDGSIGKTKFIKHG